MGVCRCIVLTSHSFQRDGLDLIGGKKQKYFRYSIGSSYYWKGFACNLEHSDCLTSDSINDAACLFWPMHQQQMQPMGYWSACGVFCAKDVTSCSIGRLQSAIGLKCKYYIGPIWHKDFSLETTRLCYCYLQILNRNSAKKLAIQLPIDQH